ncbi:MAG: mucoidy inhibitor MuiA family protein [Planctomycetes bacterium]|nr:mucoidy inhibitor MuiA family protein [Planctomycetota bacterium]NBY03070.1 mucoidy inhibitor MuiA family protein [Planctomycetota bacterium]
MLKMVKIAIFSGLLVSVGAWTALGVNAQEVKKQKSTVKESPKDTLKEPIEVKSKVVAVTIYSDSALVTREVEIPQGMGSMEVVVSSLPSKVQASSLYSEGNEGIRILATRFRNKPIKEDKREEVRKIEEEIKKNEIENQKIQAMITANTANTTFLTKLEGFASASTVNATEKGKLDSDTAISLSNYLKTERISRAQENFELTQKSKEILSGNQFLQRKLQELTSGTVRTETDAIIVIEKVNAGAGKLRLNYLVDESYWHPQYKIRAGKTAKDPVKVEYLASVHQQSGEDWGGVELTLSTAQPMLNATPPDLKGLAVSLIPKGGPVAPGKPGNALGKAGSYNANPQGYIAIPQTPMGGAALAEIQEAARSLRRQAQVDANRKDEKASNETFNYVGNLEQAKDIVFLGDERQALSDLQKPADSEREGPSVAYKLETRISIPSRNDEQVLEVARIDLPPDYFYKAVPVLTPHVYKQANLTNKSKFVLLPGEATMYSDTDFVGRMQLPLVAIGESFIVGFGTDPQLQVQRQLVEKSRSMQGGNQVLKYEYRILLSSFKQDAVKVQLWDRLPKGENEALNVTLGKVNPEISTDPVYLRQDRVNNLLRWDINLPADSNGTKANTTTYEFKVELDKQMSIGSFQSK